MSKFGWSSPPGVNESMLPGNSKAEQAAEALVELLYETVAPLRSSNASEDTEDAVVTALETIVNEAYRSGRLDAQHDSELARAADEQDRLDYLKEMGDER